MPHVITETCWGCGQTSTYDCLAIHKPAGWHTVALAGGAHMLCAICCGLVHVRGRMSEILIQSVWRCHGITLNEAGEVVSSDAGRS